MEAASDTFIVQFEEQMNGRMRCKPSSEEGEGSWTVLTFLDRYNMEDMMKSAATCRTEAANNIKMCYRVTGSSQNRELCDFCKEFPQKDVPGLDWILLDERLDPASTSGWPVDWNQQGGWWSCSPISRGLIFCQQKRLEATLFSAPGLVLLTRCGPAHILMRDLLKHTAWGLNSIRIFI